MRAFVLIAAVLASPPSLTTTYDNADGTHEIDVFDCALDNGGCPETLCEWNECGALIFDLPGMYCARLVCAPDTPAPPTVNVVDGFLADGGCLAAHGLSLDADGIIEFNVMNCDGSDVRTICRWAKYPDGGTPFLWADGGVCPDRDIKKCLGGAP